MPKYKIERVIETRYKQDVEARDMRTALNKSKRIARWELDEERESFEASESDEEPRIGFGRR